MCATSGLALHSDLHESFILFVKTQTKYHHNLSPKGRREKDHWDLLVARLTKTHVFNVQGATLFQSNKAERVIEPDTQCLPLVFMSMNESIHLHTHKHIHLHINYTALPSTCTLAHTHLCMCVHTQQYNFKHQNHIQFLPSMGAGHWHLSHLLLGNDD